MFFVAKVIFHLSLAFPSRFICIFITIMPTLQFLWFFGRLNYPYDLLQFVRSRAKCVVQRASSMINSTFLCYWNYNTKCINFVLFEGYLEWMEPKVWKAWFTTPLGAIGDTKYVWTYIFSYSHTCWKLYAWLWYRQHPLLKVFSSLPLGQWFEHFEGTNTAMLWTC